MEEEDNAREIQFFFRFIVFTTRKVRKRNKGRKSKRKMNFEPKFYGIFSTRAQNDVT